MRFPLLSAWLGFLFCASALAQKVTVDPPGAAFAGSWAVEWNTNGNLESWTTAQTSAVVSGGNLSGIATANDAQVGRLNFADGPDLDLGFNDFLEVRMQVPANYTGAIQIFFGTTMNGGFNAARVLTIPSASIPKDGAFHIYRLDVGLVLYWRGTLRDLRIDPVDGADSVGMAFAIDYLRVGDEPGAVVYLPRYSTIHPAAGSNNEFGRPVLAMESKHFRFEWDATVATHAFWTANMPQGTLRNLEECWQLYTKKLGYREPSESWTVANRDGRKYKVNVCTWYSGYFAGGEAGDFGWLNITPDGLRVDPPSGVVPHELMHVFQFHNTTQNVPGAWFEGHAEYGLARWLQHFGALLPANQRSNIHPIYLRCAHQMLGHGRDYYLTWPLFLYLDENPDELPDLGEGTMVKLWQQTQPGEYPLMTLERLTPTSSLKDIVGYFARRGATYNYAFKTEIQAALASFNQPLDDAATVRWQFTDLVQRPDDPAWWRVPYEMAPMQGAYAIHELIPSGSGAGRVVTVNLRGLPDAAREADWRASLIVISDNGAERYSTLWGSGGNSVTLGATENKVYLSVVGAPATFYNTEFDNTVSPYRSDPAKARFPYELQVTGASPRQRDNGATGGLVQVANGGGYRASGATVAATAFVGPNARVLGTASVTGTARIEDFAVVSGTAQVSGSAIVSGHALVRGNAALSGNAKVRDWALVEGGTISLNARVLEHGNIKGGTVTDLATAKGSAASLSGTLSGNAIIDGDYGDFFTGRNIASSIAFGHLPFADAGIPDSWLRPLPTGLYASYDFAAPHDSRILDQYGVTDGFTIGSPTWVAADAKRKGFLTFDGSTQAVLLDRSVADLREFTFTAWVKPLGGAVNQAVLWLGASNTRRLSFTPSDGTGRATFSIVNGGTAQTLMAPAALAQGVWTHVALTLDGSTGVLYLNGNAVATGAITVRPDQLLAANTATGLQHNYLARSESGIMPPFRGALDQVQFFGKALDAADIAAMQPATSLATAGTLLVNLKASDASAGTATWMNNGTLGNFTRNGTPNPVANVLGTGVSGVQFNGTNQSYTGPNSIADIDGSGDRTIEVWAYNPALAEEETTVSWGHRGTDRRAMAFNFGNHPNWGAATHWGDDVGWAGPNPSAGAWHHLAYTYDGSTTAKVYIDGAPANSKTLASPLNTFVSEPLNLACQRDTANGSRSLYFSGYLNSIRIHGGVLSDSQIAANAALGPVGAPPNSAPALAAVADLVLDFNSSAVSIALTVGDSDTALPAITLSGSAANTALVPVGNIVFTGTGSARTVTITPASGVAGTSIVTLLASDGAATTTRTFTFTVLNQAETWRRQNFGTTADAGLAANNADPDGDGLSNKLERAFGGDPNSASLDPTPEIDATAPLLSIIYSRARAATDLTFTIQESTDISLNSWTTAGGTSTLLEDDGIVQRLLFTAPAATSAKKFLRVQIIP